MRIEHVTDDEQRGPYFRAHCDRCTWNSGTLPFPTAAEAQHTGDLHVSLAHGNDAQHD